MMARARWGTSGKPSGVVGVRGVGGVCERGGGGGDARDAVRGKRGLLGVDVEAGRGRGACDEQRERGAG